MRLELNDAEEDFTPNLTPLIDVVFLLLVFFLAATTFSKEEVELDLELPQASHGKPAEPVEPLVIAVGKDGELFVDGRAVTMEALKQKLAAAARRNKDQEVLIRGDTRVQFGLVAQAFDACLGAALRRVSIAAEDRGSPR